MTATTNPLPSKYGEFDFPRRAVVEAMHRAEQAIRNAMYEVEALGADPLLTHAGMKLIAAKDMVSDWLEGKTGLDAQLAAPGAPEPKRADFFCFPAGTYPIDKPAPGERQIPYDVALTAIERLRGNAATTIEDHEKDGYDYNSQILPQQVAWAWAKEIHRIDAKAFLDEALQDAGEK